MEIPIEFTSSLIYQQFKHSALVDGMAGGQSNSYHFITGPRSNLWIQCDLMEVKQIGSIRVLVRGLRNYGGNYKDVEVRLGNVSGSGDFTQNELIGFLEGEKFGEIVEYNLEQPAFGRYLSFQSRTNVFLQIGEIIMTP